MTTSDHETYVANSVVDEHMAQMRGPEARRIEEEFRVPTTGTLWPGIYWIACVVVPTSDESNLHAAVVPTDDEVRQIRSFIDYKIETVYRESWQARIHSLALPLCAGHNTAIFLKRPDAPAPGTAEWAVGWSYKRMTWRDGAWPGYKSTNTHPLSLLEVMDVCENYGGYDDATKNPRWEAWKAEHGDLFTNE